MSAWKGLKNNKEITELPHYAINEFLPADSYFTSNETAKKCIDIFKDVVNEDLDCYTFIEPGAGDGAFYDQLEYNKIGIDVEYRRPDFIHQDYLKFYPIDGKYIVIGNPPFGKRGAYALAFVNRSFLFADYVAFILPMSFLSNGKGSNMKRVRNGHLIHSVILENEKFISTDVNKEIHINTLFQIWKKGEGPSYFKEYDVSEYVDIFSVNKDPKRWCGMDKLDKYDRLITSSYFNEVNVVDKFEDVKYGSGYGIIIKKNKQDILNVLDNADWNNYCSLATNHVKHIRKYSIESCLFEAGYGKIKEENKTLFKNEKITI